MPPAERDADLLDLMLELIGHIQRRLSSLAVEQFACDRDEMDLTSFRLSHIGEASKKLSTDLKSRHPNARWRPMRDMRNVLSHEYDAVAPELLWEAATQHLEHLAEVCRAELRRLEP